MISMSFWFAKFLAKVLPDGKEHMSRFYRRRGIKLGLRCNICSNIITGEPYLIKIGNDTTVSTEVKFVTHDASIGKVLGKENGSDLCGRIVVGNNCFIGLGAILLYGVELGDNTIVAAGSVVTKSFKEGNLVIGGNPAKIITRVEDFKERYGQFAYRLHGKKGQEAKKIIEATPEKLIEK